MKIDYMKADQNFQTFVDGQQNLFYKRMNITNKPKCIELTNISTVQLNPWNSESTQSYVFFQDENTSSSLKPIYRPPSIPYYTGEKYEVKRQENKIKMEVKKFDISEKKNNDHQSRQKKPKQNNMNEEAIPSNKRIWVHNFEGEKIFCQIKAEEGKVKTTSKQEKRLRTTIKNPMYIKFCNTFCSQKISKINRKKTLSNFSPKQSQPESEQVQNTKMKISLFQTRIEEPKRTNDIHEIRRKLRSKSQINRRQQLYDSFKQLQKTTNIWLYSPDKTQKQKAVLTISREISSSRSPSKKQSQKNKKNQEHSGFKLNGRKNLNIGYRKFFYPLHSVTQKDKQASVDKQIELQRIINLESLVYTGLLRKYSTTQQCSMIQKSLN